MNKNVTVLDLKYDGFNITSGCIEIDSKNIEGYESAHQSNERKEEEKKTIIKLQTNEPHLITQQSCRFLPF
jgi:hypothetical protein